ncbi:hypothetical protein Tco_0858074 [Tanacetum coccineum]|uniref:Uncharacterized protein n=1 Tax=Tanacetum coccineum TaxID=301880 RepID=A0ABQ5BAU3_9ASTR
MCSNSTIVNDGPTKKHLHAVKRIFRYLRGTVKRGLWYLKDSAIALIAFTDVDHAGCQDTRRSTSRNEDEIVKSLDDALVAPTDRLEFGKCNMRLKIDIKPKEATFQVVLDAPAFTPFYQAFLITVEVPAIYMQEFLATVSFHKDLGHSEDIIYLSDVSVDYLHQPWRAFSTIIDKCLSGKETVMDKIHLSRAQILWGMFYKKNIDYVYLLWEDLMFQIEYKEAKKTNKMSYPRFTKIIIDYFMSKDQSISRRNKMFWQTARDDTMFTVMRCISRHEDTQKPVQATKGIRIKTKAKVAKSDKKKQPAKMPKAKGLAVLSKVALTEAEQLKLATKRSKTQFHSSYASGSSDGVNTQSNVPDEQHLKTTGVDEGTGTIPGVPDVPIYESESKKESWSDSGEEDEDDENDFEDKSDGNDADDDANDDDNQEGDETNKDDDKTDSDGTESDRIKILELYDDVNVNLGNEDADMTNTDQGAPEQQNASQESGFEQLLNLENPSPADNEIASLIETSARHAMAITKITFGFTTTIPPTPSFFNPLPPQATLTPTPTTSEATTSFTSLLDFSSVFKFNDRILPQAVSDFTNHVIEKNVTESLEAAVLTRYSSQPKSTYEAAVSLSEFELTKILLDKMEERKSHLIADYKKKLDDALMTETKIKTPPLDQTEGRKEGNQAKKLSHPEIQEEPSHTINDSGVQQDQEFDMGNNDEQPADKEVSKADWFKKPERPPTPDSDWNKRQHVDSRPPQTWISQVAHAKEPHTSFDKLMDTSFDFLAFATIEQLDWHNPEGKPYPFDLSKPLLLIRDHRGRQVIPQDFFINKDLEYLKGGDLSRRYSTSVTKTKAATYDIKCIKDLVQNLWSPVKVTYDKHAYWGTSHWGSKRQYFYGFAANMSSSKDVYSRKRIIAVTRLTIMKKYDYGHLEEIEVRREDQKLYKFREGDFPRLRLQDIEDMLLLLVQKKLANLIIDKQSNLINKTTYTTNSDLKGVIYKDQNNRNRLMCADELHKFSDGTLDDVRSALNDIAKGIRMEYLPKRKWSGLEKQRARVMYEHVGPEVTRSQEGKRSQDDDKILCLVDDLKEVQDSHNKSNKLKVKDHYNMFTSEVKKSSLENSQLSQSFPVKRVSSQNSVVVIQLRGVWEKVRVFALKLIFSFPGEFRTFLGIPSHLNDQDATLF